MTGPEHYTTAESYLKAACEADTAGLTTDSLSYAQTQAMLALAAAAALGGGTVYSSDGETVGGDYSAAAELRDRIASLQRGDTGHAWHAT